MKALRWILLNGLCLMLILNGIRVYGQGFVLSDYPVIVDRTGYAEFAICSNQSTLQTLKVEVCDWSKEKSGAIVSLPESVIYTYSLASSIKVSPEKLSLKPDGCRRIQVFMMGQSKFPEGEHRAKIRITPMYVRYSSSNEQTANTAQHNYVQIEKIAPMEIPVFFRKKTHSSSFCVENLSVNATKDSTSMLNLLLNRVGTESTYGDVSVVADINGQAQEVGILRGVLIFPGMGGVNLKVPLKKTLLPEDVSKLNVTVVYSDETQIVGDAAKILFTAVDTVSVK